VVGAIGRLAVRRTSVDLTVPTLPEKIAPTHSLNNRNKMPPEPEFAADTAEGHGSLLVLAALALVVGAVSGLVGAVFRLSLAQADAFRDAAIAWAHGGGFAGFLLVTAACGGTAAIAAWLVRRYERRALGSGIPDVEAVLHGELKPAPLRLIPVKFVGGLLAIGGGLALGREGPSVQMAAIIGRFVGLAFRRSWPDCRVLLAAGAGAGLATAFNAPIAGAVFVLEELVRKFELRIAIAALGASATAISVALVLLGGAPDFHVPDLARPRIEAMPLYFVLGAAAGLAAVAYNRTLLAALAVADRFENWPVEVRAATVGAAVGILAWFMPGLVGGGDAISQRTLAGGEVLAFLPLAFLIRFGLGAVSYAAGTPGGLFAPMLALGAQFGLMFGIICQSAFAGLDIEPAAFAVVGMAAFFTGVVRAPLTGIVLVTEMTASVATLLPMLGAGFMAMTVPTLLRDAPIYDSLRERTAQRARAGKV
jgi:CIC family chloride channel protein